MADYVLDDGTQPADDQYALDTSNDPYALDTGQEDNSSWLKTLAAIIPGAALKFGESAASGIQAAQDFLGSDAGQAVSDNAPLIGPLLTGLGALSQQDPNFGSDTRHMGQGLEQNVKDWAGIQPGTYQDLTYNTVSGAVPLVASLASGAGEAAIPLIALQSASDKYGQLRDFGAEPQDAATGAGISGGVNTLASMVGVPAYLNPASSPAGRLATSFLINEATAPVQTYTDLAVNQSYGGQNPSQVDVNKSYKDALLSAGLMSVLGSAAGEYANTKKSDSSFQQERAKYGTTYEQMGKLIDEQNAAEQRANAQRLLPAPESQVPLQIGLDRNPNLLALPDPRWPQVDGNPPPGPPEPPPPPSGGQRPATVLGGILQPPVEGGQVPASELISPARASTNQVPISDLGSASIVGPQPVQVPASSLGGVQAPAQPIFHEPSGPTIRVWPERPEVATSKPKIKVSSETTGESQAAPLTKVTEAVSQNDAKQAKSDALAEPAKVTPAPEKEKTLDDIYNQILSRDTSEAKTYVNGLFGDKLNAITIPLTKAEKNPDLMTAYEGHRAGVVTEARTLHDFHEVGKPYWDLANKDKVNRALIAAGEHYDKGKPFRADAESLKKLGLDDAEIKGFHAFRQVTNHALDVLRAAIDDRIKLLPPEAQDLATARADQWFKERRNTDYFPRSRKGDWYVEIQKPDGSGYEKPFFQSASEARRFARSSERGGYVVKTEPKRLDSQAKFAYEGLPTEVVSGLAFLDPEFNSDGKLPPRGFSGHLLPRKNVPGYQTDLHNVLADYVHGAARYRASALSEKFFAKALKDAQNKHILSGDGKLYKRVRDYTDYLKGSTDQGLLSKLPSAMFHVFLGGNLKTAFLGLTQPLTTVYPALSGLVRSPEATFAKSIRLSEKYLLNRKGFIADHPEIYKQIELAKKNGVVNDGLLNQIKAKPRSQSLKLLSQGSQYLFNSVEQGTRMNAFINGLLAAEERNYKGADAFKYASDFTNNTMFDYSKGGRPDLAHTPIGKAALIFRLWGANWMRHFIKAAGEFSGNPLYIARLVGATVALGGVAAAPFAGQLFKAAQLAGMDPTKEARKNWQEKVADGIIDGIPALAGVSVGASVSPTNMGELDSDPLAILSRLALGPAVEAIQRPQRMYSYLQQGDTSRAAELFMPEAMRSAAVGRRLYREGAITPGGEHQLPPVSKYEATAKGLGFQLEKLNKANQRTNAANEFLDNRNKYVAGWNTRFAKALERKDRPYQQSLVQEWLGKQQTNPEIGEIKLDTATEKLVGNQFPELFKLLKAPKAAQPGMLDILKTYDSPLFNRSQDALGQ